jgi:alpha-N-acetylglucosaminidase
MPHLAMQFHLALAPGSYAGKSDGFRVSGARGNIHVTAATTPTLLYGVNWYLKYVAHLNVSTNGSQLGKPGLVLPAVETPIEKPALYPFRYALNENTDGYSTPYWSLARWRHEIDVFALSGTNALLIQRGADLVLYEAFRDIGYSDLDIRNWITHPAHQNWQLMGNMCCFIEPISLELLHKRAASAKQIVAMLREVGITPVLPGYYGVVPADFATHVPSHVVEKQGDWNGFTRPGWLDPRDPAFAKLAASFYKHQREIFGDTTLYDMEVFQEGGKAGDVNVPEAARAVQTALNTAHPNALWFMMAWQDSPRPELIEGVDTSKILIADIEQGRIPRDNRDEQFHGARWLYGGLWEFGGRTTLGAPLYDYAVRMPQLAAKPGSNISGTALFTEGIDTNPFAFDLYTEMAWHNTTVDLQSFASDYAHRRYGADDPHARTAWQIVQRTAYGYRADGDLHHGERDASHDSLFDSQPSLTAKTAATWSPDVMRYEIDDLKPALTELLQVAPSLRKTASYQFDVTDVARQVLANESRRLLPAIQSAYESKDRAKLHALTAEWLRDMELQDNLLRTNEFFLLGRWLSYVPAWSSSPAKLEQLNYDARSILTTWGDRRASETGLHEYANRDWAGLTRDYYAPRWKMFFDALDTSLEKNAPPAPIDWYAFGDRWNRSHKSYAFLPTGSSYQAALAIAQQLRIAPKETAHP